MAEPKAYKNPTPTVDCIIELSGHRIVLIRRAKPPLGWARPGGFVDEGEPLHVAAARAEARAFPVDALPQQLCFEHGTILADSLAYKRTGQRRKL